MHKKNLLILIALIGVLGIVWVRKSHFQLGSQKSIQLETMSEGDGVVDSSPFESMTIPYLRSRKYASSMGELEQISKNSTYTSYLTNYESDGLRINALLTKPIGEVPVGGWPAIVFVHGYIAPTTYRTQEKYVAYVNGLARQGFVVFKIDLRGHGTSEGEASGSYYSSGYVIDVLNAVAALESSDFVDAKSIGLWGHSMAGNIVLRSVAARPDIPAASIWAGAGFTYEDLRKYGLNDNSYRSPSQSVRRSSQRQRLFAAHGEFDPTDSFWKQVAATNYLSDFTGAIQLHHAKDDTVVKVNYSQDLNAFLDSTTIPHELYEYQTGGHNILGASFTSAMSRTVEFYEKYLK